jgi:hypothetical protein
MYSINVIVVWPPPSSLVRYIATLMLSIPRALIDRRPVLVSVECRNLTLLSYWGRVLGATAAWVGEGSERRHVDEIAMHLRMPDRRGPNVIEYAEKASAASTHWRGLREMLLQHPLRIMPPLDPYYG